MQLGENAAKTILKTKQPYELALFCGKYDIVHDGNLILLNPTFSKQDINDFSKIISQYKK